METKTATPDPLVIPKLGDAGTTTPTTSQPVGPQSTANGYLRNTSSQAQQPQFLDRAAVIAGMKEAVAKNHHTAVILAHDETVEECSSMGGSHAYFNVVEPETGDSNKATIHFGGHGVYLMHAFTKAQLWVAVVHIGDRPRSTLNDPWCVPNRIVNGEAFGLVPVLSLEEGRRLSDLIEQKN